MTRSCFLHYNQLMSLKSKLVGNRQFYSTLLTISVPIIIQSGITNFVNLLDNIMVGGIGTEGLSGVGIVNQLIFVYNLAIFGALSGVGIFSAQYYGSRNIEGIRNTMRFKLMVAAVITAAAIIILETAGARLIGLYLNGSDDGGNLGLTLEYGLAYMRIAIIGLPFFMIIQVYSSTLRECGETIMPMKAGIVSIIVNLTFNYLLIYGKLGFPKLGVVGAAIATALSRAVESSIILIWSHSNAKLRFTFLQNIYSSLRIPGKLVGRIAKIGTPMLINEILWSVGMAAMNQCYSLRGLNAVAAFNISSTIMNLFNVVLFSIGASLGVIVGNILGSGDMEKAVDYDRKIIAFSTFICVLIGAVMFASAPLFPKLYNTSEEAKAIAADVIRIAACFLPVVAMKNGSYYTLRSGGRTYITMAFDSGMIWTISLPIAYFLSRFTDMNPVLIFLFVQLGDIIKVIIGLILVKGKVWLRNIVS